MKKRLGLLAGCLNQDLDSNIFLPLVIYSKSIESFSLKNY